jgi:hypothetical protein
MILVFELFFFTGSELLYLTRLLLPSLSEESKVTTGCQPHFPLPLHVATASGKNNLNEEITPLLPTGIGERYCIAKPNQI